MTTEAVSASGPAGLGFASRRAPPGALAARPASRPSVIRLVSFGGLAGVAAWRYAMIEVSPPPVRVLALVALATVVAAGMLPGEGERGPALRRGVIIALALPAALLIAGVPPRMLAPSQWERLAHGIGAGTQTIAVTTWPFPGHGRWARLDILLVLAVVPIAAAGLGFWPESQGRQAALRSGARRMVAFALLIGLYIIGVSDSNDGVTSIEGLAILGLLVSWLWLPALPSRGLPAAAAWLLLLGATAGLIAGPVASSRPWFDYRAWNLLGASRPSVFAWDQTFGPIIWPRSRRTMFTVRTSAPGLWKVTTLDRFDGLRFLRSGTSTSSETDLPLPLNDRWYQFATFTVAGLGTRILPTQDGIPEGVNARFPVRYQADGTVSTGARQIAAGSSYSVMSYVPRPTPAELRQAPRTFPAAYLRYTAFDLPTPAQSGLRLRTYAARTGVFFTRDTVGSAAPGRPPGATPPVAGRILASPYAAMYRLARGITAESRSTYDAALAVQAYLRANYAYSEQPPVRRYPLPAFLFLDRIGYCQQFSGAMALMLRMIGIPARVAVGFRTGAHDASTGLYRVSARDAHSWVEVFFSGIGWVPFDPTPPASRLRPPHVAPAYAQPTSDPLQAIAATVGAPPVSAASRAGSVRAVHPGGAGPDLWLSLAAATLLAVLAGAARWGAGRRLLSQSLRGDGELAARELVRALHRLGYRLPATVTLRQVEAVVRVHGGAESARYVRLLGERRYGFRPGAPVTLRDRSRLRHGLTAHLGLLDRLRGHWALPPGTSAARLHHARPTPPAPRRGPPRTADRRSGRQAARARWRWPASPGS